MKAESEGEGGVKERKIESVCGGGVKCFYNEGTEQTKPFSLLT